MPLGGDGRPFIPFIPFVPYIPFVPFIPFPFIPRTDGLYGSPGDWLARRGKAPFIIGGGPPGPYCSSSSREAVSEFARDSACMAPRSTVPYRFDEHDISGSSMMLVCMLGMDWSTRLDRFLPPKPGRNRPPRGGIPPDSGFLRNWDCDGILRFFLEVTLIMSKLSASTMDAPPAAVGSK